MALSYQTALATARLQKVIDLLDAGGAAKIIIGTSALSGATGVLATFVLPVPSATISGRVLTFSGMAISAVAAAGGIAAKAELRKNDGTTVILSGLTVGVSGSGAHLIVDTASVVSGRTVYVLSGTITHP